MAITTGTNLDEQLFGSSQDDELYGGNGQDTLWGFAGDDLIDAGAGNDEVLFGGRGNDILVGKVDASAAYSGNDGTDILDFGRSTADAGQIFYIKRGEGLIGEAPETAVDPAQTEFFFAGIEKFYGTDFGDKIFQLGDIANVYGRGGDDTMIGDYRDNRMFGGEDSDVLRGNDGDDRLFGGNGADLVKGGGGKDFLNGGAGGDRFRGGKGDDDIRGGGGADQIFGDLGDDKMKGGGGADGFVFYPGEGHDIIRDFDAAEGDIIYLPHFADFPESYAELLDRASNANGNVLIEIDEGATIQINNASVGDLEEDWFVFENFVLEIF